MKEGLRCNKAGTGVVGQPSGGGSSAVSELVGSAQSRESVSLRVGTHVEVSSSTLAQVFSLPPPWGTTNTLILYFRTI